MNSDLIMKSDVLDIIFENRNKEYGAYPLRKFYQVRLYKSMGIMLSIVTLLCCVTLIPTNKKMAELSYSTKETILTNVYRPKAVIPAASEALQKQAVQKQASVKPAQQNAGNKILFVKDSVQQIIQPMNLTTAVPINATVIGLSGATDGSSAATGKNDGKSIEETTGSASVDVNTPLNTADVYPSFPGGDEALRKFLLANLRTPNDMPDDATISVQVEFVVGYDGKLKSFKVIKDGGDDFNSEVIRVLKKMPNWIPGKAKGQNVSVYHIIPVKFVSQDANP